MFKLYNKVLFITSCSKCEASRRFCVNSVLCKNTLTVRDNERISEKTVCNFHNDSLEVYTNSLILDNVMKWKTYNFSFLSKPIIFKSNSIFKMCDDPDHLIRYLQQCIDGHSKVTESTLTQFMSTMARHGRIDGLILIDRLNEKYNYRIKKSELQMNFAEAYWANSNLDSMFKIFMTLYQTDKTKINYALEYIIYTIVKSHGVASVVMVSKFVNTVVIKYGNHYPMSILWKYLFISELYNDNLEAEKLLQKNRNLIKTIVYLVPVITRSSLKKHKVNCVQRLMIVLLKYNQINTYHWILKSLFEYYYTLGNVRQCKEIMKHSIELNLPLTQAQQTQLINMVFKNKQPQKINQKVTETIFKLMF